MKTSYTSAFKAKVVPDLLKEDKTLAQLAAEHHVHLHVLRELPSSTVLTSCI